MWNKNYRKTNRTKTKHKVKIKVALCTALIFFWHRLKGVVLNKQTLHLSRSLRERLDMRKTFVLQHVRGPKWLPDENIFLSRTLSFWSLKSFFSTLLGDSSDGVSSFLAIRLHCESSLSGAVSLQWGSSRHLLPPWLLTVGRSIIQEVGCHFPFPFDLNHPATLQHVPFVCKHLVEVCSHLWLERNRQIYIYEPEWSMFI